MINNWIGFNDDTLPVVLEQLHIKKEGDHLLNEEEGTIVKCEICNTKLAEDDIGNIVPGSKKFYCRNLACFAEYIHDSL